MKVLVEAVGSMVFGPQLKYYNELGWELVGIDITNKAFGFYKNIKSYIVPRYSESHCFDVIEEIIKKESIAIVFPTINEGLLEWSRRKEDFKKKYNTVVAISDIEVIDTCTDKWKTYHFFINNQIPTPNTSLEKKYDLLKPRSGRGSQGIYHTKAVDDQFNMEGYLSQEIVKGDEYTIDVLCDFDSNPIYIIPRKRIDVESGVSVKGKTVYDKQLIEYAKIIVKALKPIGMINIQCFRNNEEIYFIEINPRIAGGSSLSFASSDNWFRAIEKFLNNETYTKEEITFDNYMLRYYEDVMVNEKDLIT